MTTDQWIPTSFFLAAIANQRLEQDALDGVQALVRLYYGNFTDAERLEGDFLAALHTIEACIEGDVDFDDAIRSVEAELRTEGRAVRTLDAEED